MNHGGMSCGAATFSLGLIASPYCLPPGSPLGAFQSTGSFFPAPRNTTFPRMLMVLSGGISVDVDLGSLDRHRARRLDVARPRRLDRHVRRGLHLVVLADLHLGALARLGLDGVGLHPERALGLEQHVAALGLD